MPRRVRDRLLIAVVACAVGPAVSACGGGDDDGPGGVTALMDSGGGFFDAPFPNPTRLRADGTVRVDDFPNERGSPLADEYIAAIDGFSEGFGRHTGVWFPLSGAIDPATLPATVAETQSADSPVYVVNVDASSPAYGQIVPVEVAFKAEPETYSPANLLVLVPYQGWGLEPETWYAGVVTDRVRDLDGNPLVPAPLLDETERLIDLLESVDRDPAEVVAATVFRTGHHTRRTAAMREAALARPAPVASGFTALDDFPTFVTVEASVELPLYQVGDEPYDDPGEGHVVFGAGDVPVEQAAETVRFSLSIPKTPMPPGGYPLLLYSAGQGGSYRQVIDRGVDATGNDGDGPAMFLANRGIAALGVEANLTGPRHPSLSTEGIDFFNVQNPVALRDNHRQAVTEFAVLIRMVSSLIVPAAVVPGAATDVTFDADNLYMHGHSTGSLITAMSLGVHPELAAGLLTGSGGSWMYNLTMKQTPDIPQIVGALLGLYVGDEVDLFDPFLHLIATLWEPIEPMSYAPLWTDRAGADPVPVLLIGGVTDTYFLPRMITALAMAGRMDVGEPLVENTIVDGLSFVGAGRIALPAGGNHPSGTTAIVVQHAQRGDDDGHYVTFHLPAPKFQYSCFLADVASGVDAPVVRAAIENGLAPCD